ncbi:CAP domain-containing protein, partial [Porcipelethomonas sp.]|uniref:CAP domain-containing protein n=1 Tax=Porcipelethomonas sp. TaxID=2981675 RepID=UPI003EF6AE47
MDFFKRLVSAAVSAACAISALSGSFVMTSFADNTDAEVLAVTSEQDETREKIERVVELVNEERAKEGIAPVTLNETLTDAAMLRAEEITENFEHTRPDGTSCFTVLDDYNIGYWGCAENIAAGNSTADATMNQWINSSGHYANLMDSSYSEIGVGVVYDPDTTYGYYWVQLFIDPTDPIPTATTTPAVTAVSLSYDKVTTTTTTTTKAATSTTTTTPAVTAVSLSYDKVTTTTTTTTKAATTTTTTTPAVTDDSLSYDTAVTAVSLSISIDDDMIDADGNNVNWYFADETSFDTSWITVMSWDEDITADVTIDFGGATPENTYDGKYFDYDVPFTVTYNGATCEGAMYVKIGQRGDANCDHKVNARDCAFIANDRAQLYGSKNTTLTDTEGDFALFLANADESISEQNTDWYGKREINAHDAAVIARYLAQIYKNPDSLLLDIVNMPITGYPSGNESLSVSSVTGSPGETVTLEIAVAADNNLESLEAVLTWEDAALAASKASSPICSWSSDAGDGYVTIVAYKDYAIADGTVATIDFTIPEDAVDGTIYDISVEQLNSFRIFDGEDTADTVSVSGGKITVNNVPHLSQTAMSLNIRESRMLSVLYSDGEAIEASWSSSNDAVASVSDSGLVTANGLGTATIYATTEDGTCYECEVSVLRDDITAPALWLSDCEGAPGETVTMYINVAADNDFSAVDLIIEHDSSLIADEVYSVSKASVASSTADGIVSVVAFTDNSLTDGAIAAIDFTIPEDAESGTVYNVKVPQVDGFIIFSGDDLADSVSTFGGTITVKEFEKPNYLSYEKYDSDDDGIYDYALITGCNESAVSVDIPAEI